jgi:hypothetical protein
MTLKDLRKAHNLLWGFLAKDAAREKDDFFKLMNLSRDYIPSSKCYACEGASHVAKDYNYCIDACICCPCSWGNDVQGVDSYLPCWHGGYYFKWNVTNGQEREYWAMKIRDAWALKMEV